MTTVFVSGRGVFGAVVADQLAQIPGVRVIGTASPELRTGQHTDDGAMAWDRLRLHAYRLDLPWVRAEDLRARHVPKGTDLIVAAHSHAYVGRATRARARYAIGYHPSLLPLHRGRDAIRWTLRDGDRVTGGSVYHLTDNVDGGPIAWQKHLLVPYGVTARELWREHLAPMGVLALTDCVVDVHEGSDLPRRAQDERLATWEPSMDAAPLHRPELLELTSR